MPGRSSTRRIREQLERLRRPEALATQVPVERPVEWDDILIADVVSTIDDEPFVEDTDAEFGLREDTTLLVPGLAEAFLGMQAGEEKTVELPIPDDFQVERYQGKTASFTLTVKEIKEEQLPELDDDLAQQVNEEEFPTFQALRDRIENDLSEQKQRESDNKAQQEAIDAMVDRATLEDPRVYVEREIDSLVRENAGQDRDQYLQYLERMGQTEQEFRESLAEEAQRRVERSLVISKLAEIEDIDVSEQEVDEQLDNLVQPAGEEASRLRELFDTDEGRATIRRNVLSDKTLARIVEIATVGDGSGGDAEQTSAAAAAQPESGDAADANRKGCRATDQPAIHRRQDVILIPPSKNGPAPNAPSISLLLKERIVFLGTPVALRSNREPHCRPAALPAAGMTRSADISLYIHSPGGVISAGLAIYDTMQLVEPDVSTICVGQTASMGTVLLCAGARQALRSAERHRAHAPGARRCARSGFGHRDRGQGILHGQRDHPEHHFATHGTGCGAHYQGLRP
ncbi:MAG: trigger factor [Dehalococcoidia bacterium]|nr:trigger factor [Dehalococcoidia bacterium]